MTPSLVLGHEASDDALELEVVAHPIANLALLHNNVPILRSVQITNVSDRPIDDLRVTARLSGLADGTAPEWSETLPRLAPGEAHRWELIRAVAPSRHHLSTLNEAYDAQIVVAAGVDERSISVDIPLRLLAQNEWFAASFCFESLASFVQPNTAGVHALLSEASDILQTSTGSNSLEGYQGGPQRAGTIAAAVYAALCARNLRYINPPASFENLGQKIRSPQDVLDQRFGTCIDLAVLYAACLEQAGLNPLIWLTKGHAFVGFMREDTALPRPVLDEPNKMLNLAESGRAVILEAAFYGGENAPTFLQAVNAAAKHLANPSSLMFVLDVRAAGNAGVTPFATGVQTEQQMAQAELSKAAATRDLSLPATLTAIRDDDQVLDLTDNAPTRVKKWKRALLDLSTRNRLLNMQPSREVIHLVLPGQALAMADDLVHAGKKLTLRPGDDFSGVQVLSGVRSPFDLGEDALIDVLAKRREVFAMVSEQKYLATMKHLQRSARTLLEETGNTNLFIAFGSLVHRTTTGSEANAPLFLLPVRVVGGTGKSRYEIIVDTTGIAAPNHCLIEWLRVKHNVVIDALNNPPTDESGIDIPAALSAIREALLHNNLDFRIDETAAIAIFKFGTLGLWQDLQESWDTLEQSPLVRHLTHTAGETFIDPEATSDEPLDAFKPRETTHPLPVHYDGSQLKAIELSAAGRTFVLEGPPGTGKSQTITNLIARNLAAGRTVLFVAEKQAALQVVKRRLEAVGLAPFTLDLHGAAQKSENIRKQLKDALEFKADYNQRTWDTEVATWRVRHQTLDVYPGLIHDRNAADDSLWSAAQAVASNPDSPYLDIPMTFAATTSAEQMRVVRDALLDFGRTARPADTVLDSPWVIGAEVGTDDVLAAECARAGRALSALHADPAAERIAGTLDDPDAIDTLVAHARWEAGSPVVTADELVRFQNPAWQQQYQHCTGQFTTFIERTRPYTDRFIPTFLTTGDAATIATAIRDSQHGMLGKRKRAEQATVLLRAVLNPGVDVTLEDALPLLDSIPGLRAEHQSLRASVADVLGSHLPTTWDPLDPAARTILEGVAARLSTVFEFARNHPREWQALRAESAVGPQTLDVLSELGAAWRSWVGVLGATIDSQARWRGGRRWLDAWDQTHAAWSSDITDRGAAVVRRYVTLQNQLRPLRNAGLDAIADDLLAGRTPAAEGEARFLAGLARTSVRERLAHGGLTEFVQAKQDGNVGDFAAASDRIRDLLADALPAQLAAQRSFDPDRLTGKFGDLHRALGGKRNASTVRSLVHKYGPEIQAAAPCFLVSPSSLAQYVPPGSITFDVVVFDEASQVTVAQSIGALGRAKSAVIVGDSKQMPPTMIGVASGGDAEDEEDLEESVPEDLESILTECVESGVPRLPLTWHYRSQDESLIAFSNEKYYDSKLASLPSPGRSADAGIEWRRVDGHFNREDTKNDYRTNRVEADAIVAEVRRLVHATPPQRSIGIVTFNRQQQDMVLNLLEATKDETILDLLDADAVDGLFVKNLENVQGDERDVILFSTAFSKRPGDSQMPLNFGPLTRAGGEKRLNVAVTRAKRKVVVFSSFDPTDIDLSRTRSIGMAHLRGYLEAAAAQTSGTETFDPKSSDSLQTQIADTLRDNGFEVQQNYGMSDFVVDIAVRSPQSERWQVAVMLDGPRWDRRETVTDRDVMPGLLHDRMGWSSVLRVWLPEWLSDSQSAIAQVRAAVEVAEEERAEAERAAAEQAAAERVAAASANGERPHDVPVDDESSPADEVVAAPAVEESEDPADVSAPESKTVLESPIPSEAPEGYDDAPASQPSLVIASTAAATIDEPTSRVPVKQVYQQVPTTPLGSRDDLENTDDAALRATIRNALIDTVNTCGPIELTALSGSIVRRFGFEKAHGRRRQFVETLLPSNLIKYGDLGSFVWPVQLDPGTWSAFRVPAVGDDKRALDEIAPEEIINALVYAADGRRKDAEQVVRAALGEFGLTRLAQPSRDRLESCLDLALQTGQITFDDGVYRAAR
ncbi:DUF4011 domain-containing protein [Gordonia neofelifaecis]|uniref:Putative DNA helicase n=1 Tax=Gordonia neofelifaecis NRRL B-59395 TaxID=644548 RepID=F1YE02_9ACTN|nr:DUF4011 domain-containing protein [Gordonia neofelifaecis]EGD57092.1 putative DNA helicase [Gordonia neofelifaecis NRRL B-59395]